MTSLMSKIVLAQLSQPSRHTVAIRVGAVVKAGAQIARITGPVAVTVYLHWIRLATTVVLAEVLSS